jgi:uncharacterized RDD family membrane protein YckC
MSDGINPYSPSPNVGGDFQGQSYGGQAPLADLGKRFLGALLDGLAGLVLVGPGYAIMIAGAVQSEGQQNPSPLTFVGLGLLLLGGLALLVIQLVLLAKRSQTIGKYVMKTQITNFQTHQPADFVKSFVLRSLVSGLIGAVPFVGAIYALADILLIFRQDRRCIHDLIAGTYVSNISGRR